MRNRFQAFAFTNATTCTAYTAAPDAVAVDALMLGPPTPSQQTGGASSGRINKDGPERQARMEEDDGLVIRQRPQARSDNSARRKQRAGYEANPNDWFDPEDGGLRCMADPVPPVGLVGYHFSLTRYFCSYSTS